MVASLLLPLLAPATGCAADGTASTMPNARATPQSATALRQPSGSEQGPTVTSQSRSAKPALSYTSIDTTAPIAALTFDDGPHTTNTPRLLDILKKRNVRATFYVVGQNVANYPDIARRIVDEGHEIANHSWSHPWFTKMSDNAVRSQLQRTHDIIRETTGVEPRNMRPPYGAISSRQKVWIHSEFGYPTIMWSLDPLDWKNRNAGVVSSRILSQTQPGAIILAHDIHATTVAAMPTVIDGLLERGYRLVTVSELIAFDGAPPRLAGGPVVPVPDAGR